MTALGVVGVLLAGAVCGALNGVIVVYGRLQPIIVTIATSAIFYGIALVLRPQPGGSINPDLADLMTRSTYWVPSSLIILLAVVLLDLAALPALGHRPRGLCDRLVRAGGLHVGRRHRPGEANGLHAGGLLSAIAGLSLTALTYTGEARAALAADYTLNSIAAVVIGGTSLFGGAGSAIGSIFGAFVMRTVGDLLFVFDMNPVLQPLFVGIVLLFAVSLGSLRLLRIKNKLDLYR